MEGADGAVPIFVSSNSLSSNACRGRSLNLYPSANEFDCHLNIRLVNKGYEDLEQCCEEGCVR